MTHQKRYLSVVFRIPAVYIRGGLSRASAELAFYLLFSVCPVVMMIHSLLTVISIPQEDFVRLSHILPDGVRLILLNYLDFLQNAPSLQPFLIGLVLALWFLSRAVRSVIHTFDDIFGKNTERRWLHRMVLSVGITLAGILIFLCSVVLFAAGRWFSVGRFGSALQVGGRFTLCNALLIAAAILLILFYLLLCFRLLSSVPLRWRESLPGAAAALICWWFLTKALIVYVDHMARFDLLYGSIGAVMVLMLWLYFGAAALYLGAVLNYVLYDERNRKMIA